jgi:hypothetical protein
LGTIREGRSASDVERRIVTGLAVSSVFVRKIRRFWRDDLLESPELGRVARWCLEHFDKYGRVADTDLGAIYFERVQSEGVPKAEAEYIERVLETVSAEYGRDELFNADYLYDRTVKYLRQREQKTYLDEVMVASERGDDEAVERALRSFRPTSFETTRGLDVNSPQGFEAIERAFGTVRKPVVEYPGDLGDMLNSELSRASLVAFLAPEKRGKCLPGDQRVLLSNGDVLPIRDVIRDERRDVIAYDETIGQFVPSTITDFYVNGVKDVWSVTTRTGRKVKVTKNHPFLTPDGWVELQDLEIGRYIAVPKEIPVFGSETLPDEKIRLLAYFIAEGCLGNEMRERVQFTTADEDIRRDFDRCVSAMGCRTVWKGINCGVYNAEAVRGLHRHNHVRNFLFENGLMNKRSYDKLVPPIVFRLNSAEISLFLSVLYTCDGWVDGSGKGVGFSVANERLARQVQELLSRFGIVSRVHFKENICKGAWTVAVRDCENITRFRNRVGCLFGKGEKLCRVTSDSPTVLRSFLDKFPSEVARRFYDDVEREFGVFGVRRDRHDPRWRAFVKCFTKAPAIRQQLDKGLPIMRQSFTEVSDTVAGVKYLNSQILWDEILSIDFVGSEETFDLTVANQHNFVAENVLVHNTWWLLDIVVRAIRQQRNVAFFQGGDMTQDQQLRRFGVHLAGWSDDPKACVEHWYAVGDCVKNQFDACDRSDRNCDHGIHEGQLEEFYKDRGSFECLSTLTEKARDFPDYRPCESGTCAVRRPTVWLMHVDAREVLTGKIARRHAEHFFRRHRRRFKLATYSRNTLTTAEMDSCLDEWERVDDFVPDVIVVDYPDIMSSDVKEFRHKQDDIWGGLRRVSQERHALLVTVTQADAASYKQGKLSVGNFTEDKRKNAHVTAMFALNQSPDGREKALGVIRVGAILVRDGAFSVDDQVVVMQHLNRGRPFTGSYLLK